MEKKALGRGLGALLPAVEIENSKENQHLMDIDISHVMPNKNQPRREFSEDELKNLSESISQSGLLQPIVVRRKGDGFFEIIAGERRWRAAKKAGFTSIPAILRNVNDNKAMVLALVENIQRQNLNPLETAMAYHRMITEFGMTQEQIATEMGIDRSSVGNLIRIVGLPNKIKELVASEAISLGHAKVILSIEGSENQEKLALQIIEGQLSVRNTEKLVNKQFKDKKNIKTVSTSSLSQDLEEKVQKKLGTKVSIQSKGKGGGKIVVHYYSQDDLDRILDVIFQ